jgi:hypothetical protein
MKIPEMKVSPKISTDPFDLTGKPVKPVVDSRTDEEIEDWWRKAAYRKPVSQGRGSPSAGDDAQRDRGAGAPGFR